MVGPHDEEMRKRALSKWASSKYAKLVGTIDRTPKPVHWAEYEENPILGPTETWESDGLLHPCIIKEGGTYYAFYNSFHAANEAIGWAKSDSIFGPYEKNPDNPVLEHGPAGAWDSDDVMCPAVFRFGSTFFLMYQGYDGTDRQLGIATSDSVEGPYSKYEGNPVVELGGSGEFDESAVFEPGTVKIGSTLLCYYTARDADDRSSIGLAKSRDGFSWFKESYGPERDYLAGPILKPTQGLDFRPAGSDWTQPRLLYHNDVLYLTWQARAEKTDGGTVNVLARSRDLVNFRKWPRYVTAPGPSGTWNSNGTTQLDMIYEDGSFYGLAVGYDGTNWRIGAFQAGVL